MSVPDYTIGFTEAEVLEILAAQKAELKKTMASWQESGGSVTKRQIAEINAIIAACQRALVKLNPGVYASRNKRVAQSTMSSIFVR